MNTLCPFCSCVLVEAPGTDWAHVFAQAMGGRSRVPSCKACNSSIGHSIEGPLLRSETVLGLACAAAGYVDLTLLSADPETGAEMDVNATDDSVRMRNPVEKTELRDGVIKYGVQAPPEQAAAIVEGIVTKKGGTPQDVANIMAGATSHAAQILGAGVTLQAPGLEAQLCAAIALAAGAHELGDSYILSNAASDLRLTLWDGSHAKLVPLSSLDGVVAEAARLADGAERWCSQNSVSPQGVETTLVLVTTLSALQLPFGFALAAQGLLGKHPHAFFAD